MGLGYYRIVEDEDGKLCETCAKMNGKVFKYEDYEQGVTAPPFHENCRGKVEELAGGASIVKQGRDEENGWADEAADRDDLNDWTATLNVLGYDISLGKVFGMKYDELTGMIYNSKRQKFQKKAGYHDIYDSWASTFMPFSLHAPKTEGSALIEEDGVKAAKMVTHWVWMGDYYDWGKNSGIFDSYDIPRKSIYGGESSILINNKYLPEDEFEQKIQLYDKNGDLMLAFDSAEMYDDSTSDWVFGCIPSDLQPSKITGTIKHANRAYVTAIAYAGDSQIMYSAPKQDENGMWYTNWEYDTRAQVVYGEIRL